MRQRKMIVAASTLCVTLAALMNACSTDDNGTSIAPGYNGQHDAAAPPVTTPVTDGATADATADATVSTNDSGTSAVTLTILHTSDLHSNVVNYDYFSGRVPAGTASDPPRGIAPLATIIRDERAKASCSLLIDSGDTIQGTPLGTYYALKDNTPIHPMAAAMNALGYDAMAVGNHEFNYGLPVLNKFMSEVKFPVLAANVRKSSDGSEAFTPYVIKTVCGVRVGILGLVTPGVAVWDQGDHIAGLRFDTPLDTAKAYVPKMRAEGADIVVVSYHSGPERTPATATAPKAADWLTDPATWTPSNGLPNENQVLAIAEQVTGVDAILSGHTHLSIPKIVDHNVLIAQPGYWGSYVGKYTFSLNRTATSWDVTSKDATVIPLTSATANDPAVLAAVKQADETTRTYVSTKIGTAAGAFPGGFEARLHDSALADLINLVQEEAAERAGHKVDVSAAAIFNNTGKIAQGDILLRDAYSVYVYDNTLYVMQITGKTLRAALEQDAKYWRQIAPNPTLAAPSDGGIADGGVVFDAAIDDAGAITVLPGSAADLATLHNVVFTTADYNWDIYRGIKYTVDLTRPAGSRITSLARTNGAPITDAESLLIAVNNYRGSGGGYDAIADAGTLVWRSADGVRDYVADYITRKSMDGGIDPTQVSTPCEMSLVPNLYPLYYPGAPAPTCP